MSHISQGVPVKSIYADLSLLITTIVWGTGFPGMVYALNSGMNISFILLIRFTVASIILVLLFSKRIRKMRKQDLMHGLIAGTFLFLAFFIQTVGLQYTSPSNNAFITATYVIMVPFMSWLLFKNMPQRKYFILPFVTFLGVVILTYRPGTGFNFTIGDTFTLVCAAFFALHVAYLDTASKVTDTGILTFVQLATAAVLSFLYFLVFDRGSAGVEVNWSQGLLWAIYLGVFATFVAYFLQTFAQKHTTSTKTAIILSCESLFGSLFSVLLGLEPFTVFLVAGGTVIFSSVILSEMKLPLRKTKREKKQHTSSSMVRELE